MCILSSENRSTDITKWVCVTLQPQVGRFGLFTMMRVAQVLGSGPRGVVACNILRNVQWHYHNATLFYRAELKFKYDLLLEAPHVRSSVLPTGMLLSNYLINIGETLCVANSSRAKLCVTNGDGGFKNSLNMFGMMCSYTYVILCFK